MFDPKTDEVTGGWRKLHNELHYLYSSPNIIRMIKSRRMRWAEHVTCFRDEKCIQNFGQKPEGNIPLGRPKCRWENNIKMDLKEIGCESMDLIYVAQNRDWW
jgi:hypothetical protein